MSRTSEGQTVSGSALSCHIANHLFVTINRSHHWMLLLDGCLSIFARLRQEAVIAGCVGQISVVNLESFPQNLNTTTSRVAASRNFTIRSCIHGCLAPLAIHQSRRHSDVASASTPGQHFCRLSPYLIVSDMERWMAVMCVAPRV